MVQKEDQTKGEVDDGRLGDGQLECDTMLSIQGNGGVSSRHGNSSRSRVHHKGALLTICVMLILVVAAVTAPMPFVAFSPGPTFDVTGSINGSPVIEISGTDPRTGESVQTYPAEPRQDGSEATSRRGELRMATIYESGSPGHRLTFVNLVRALLTPHVDVRSYHDYYPPDLSGSQLKTISRAQMASSQSSASAAALKELGWKVPATVTIKGVSPAAEIRGTVKDGDILVSLKTPDGVEHAVNEASVPLSVMRTQASGSVIVLTVNRNGENINIPVISHTEAELKKRFESFTAQSQGVENPQSGSHQEETRKSPHPKKSSSPISSPQSKSRENNVDDEGSRLGLYLSNDIKMPFDVKVHLENVGGPSAGLMFALGIIDELTPGDITGGAKIAGTGSITYDAHIEPIGGIKQKMWGSRSSGAEWFFSPSKNCDEVVGNVPEGLRVVRVSTLSQALEAVKNIAAHKTDQLPTCEAAR